jgi:hypothetical protein
MIPPIHENTACRLMDMVMKDPLSCSSEYDMAMYPIVTKINPAEIPIATPAKIGNPSLPV